MSDDARRQKTPDWQPFDTAPHDGQTVSVLMRSGAITVAEYWPPAPVELDPRQESGGWAFDTQCLRIDFDDEPVGWKPLNSGLENHHASR